MKNWSPQEVIDAWNRGELPAGRFLASLKPWLFPRLKEATWSPFGRYYKLRGILFKLRGVKQFVDLEHFLRWSIVAVEPMRSLATEIRGPTYWGNTEDNESVVEGFVNPIQQTLKTVSFSSLGFAPGEALGEVEESNWRLGPDGLRADQLNREESAARNEAEARVATLRIFGGYTLTEISGQLGLPLQEVQHLWLRVASFMGEAGPPGQEAGIIATFDFPDANLLRALAEHPDLLKTLSWRQFEKVLAACLDRLGFEIELQRGTKDGGIDIFAVRHDGPFGSHRYLLQAKQTTRKVGVAPVRELLFLHQLYRPSKTCLATTSSFTKGAWALAEDFRWQLELRDYDRLLEWIREAAQS